MDHIRLAQALRPKNRLPDAAPIGANAASDTESPVTRGYLSSVVPRLLCHGSSASCSVPILLDRLCPAFLPFLAIHGHQNHELGPNFAHQTPKNHASNPSRYFRVLYYVRSNLPLFPNRQEQDA